MIRRNYIQTIAPMLQMDRKTVQSKSKPIPKEQKYNRYTYKKDPQQLLMEQNKYVTSSNKKYHQYKDWKQNKNKAQEENKEHNKYKQPLNQFSDNQGHFIQKYKKDQDCEIQQMFKKEQVAEFQNVGKGRKSFDGNNLTYNYLRNNNRQNYQEQGERHKRRDSVNVPRFAFEREINQSPQRQRKNYQSTRKYSSNLQVEKPSTKLAELSAKSHTKSFTPHFEPIDRVNFGRKEETSIFDYPKKVSERKKEYKQLMNDPPYMNNPRDSRKENYLSERITAPRPPSDYNRYIEQSSAIVSTSDDRSSMDDRVADKLKLISNFNDQINERIKNIIVCFEQLKNKI